MRIGDKLIACAVLEDGTRLINQETFMTTLGRSAKAKGGTGSSASAIPPFLSARNLQVIAGPDLMADAAPILYRTPTGGKSYGFRAEILPDVCETYLEARHQGALLKSQEPAAQAAEILVRGLARVGIIALVDEATGYEVARERDALQAILNEYVAESLRPWVKQFPDEFFREMYRLYGWQYNGTSRRPKYVGNFINKYIYDVLPKPVHGELERLNPKDEKGNRAHKHHQYLSEGTGLSALDRHIASVTTLMRVSPTKTQFDALFRDAFPDPNKTPTLFISIDE